MIWRKEENIGKERYRKWQRKCIEKREEEEEWNLDKREKS